MKLYWIAFYLFSFFTYSVDFDGVIHIHGNKMINVGDHLDVELQLQKEFSLVEIKNILKAAKNKLPPFHIVDVVGEFPTYSLRAIYEKPFKSSDKEVLIKLESLNFLLRNSELLNPQGLKLDKKFHVYEPEAIGLVKKFGRWVLFPLLLVFLLLLWLVFKFIKVLSVKAKAKKEQKLWSERVLKAYSRDDYEVLYTEKKSWRKHFPNKEVNDFIEALNQFQFKKEWSQEDHAAVTKAFEGVRNHASN